MRAMRFVSQHLRHLILFLTILPLQVFATAQVPDVLLYQGEEYALFEEPLEDYFKIFGNSPDNILKPVHSANWRGYQATWEIKNGKLLLIKLQREEVKVTAPGEFDFHTKDITISDIISNKTLPVFAEWYSGTLILPQGKKLQYIHMPYASIYEREILLEIEKGILAKSAMHDNTKDEKLLFSSYTDRKWVGLARNTVLDSVDWIDARLLVDKENKLSRLAGKYVKKRETFKTRGIFFDYQNQKRLDIEETVKTPSIEIPIYKFPDDILICPIGKTCQDKNFNVISEGKPVEIEACWMENKKEGRAGVQVIAIRQLKLGETMHSANFPAEFIMLKKIKN